jgi:hypothetical protein
MKVFTVYTRCKPFIGNEGVMKEGSGLVHSTLHTLSYFAYVIINIILLFGLSNCRFLRFSYQTLE